MDPLERELLQPLASIESAATLDALDALRVGLLGKSGAITEQLKHPGTVNQVTTIMRIMSTHADANHCGWESIDWF